MTDGELREIREHTAEERMSCTCYWHMRTHDERRKLLTYVDELRAENARLTRAEKPHPWGDFLRARAICLRWLRDEFGETPEQTCAHLAMDPVQVQLILATPEEDL